MKRAFDYNKEESLSKKSKASGAEQVIMETLPEAAALLLKTQANGDALRLFFEPYCAISDSDILGQIVEDGI